MRIILFQGMYWMSLFNFKQCFNAIIKSSVYAQCYWFLFVSHQLFQHFQFCANTKLQLDVSFVLHLYFYLFLKSNNNFPKQWFIANNIKWKIILLSCLSFGLLQFVINISRTCEIKLISTFVYIASNNTLDLSLIISISPPFQIATKIVRDIRLGEK